MESEWNNEVSRFLRQGSIDATYYCPDQVNHNPDSPILRGEVVLSHTLGHQLSD